MTICAVVDNQTGEQLNLIVAEPSEVAPEGCRLVEIPDGYFWNGSDVVISEIPDGD
jgi:hypothetical protein